MPRARRVHPHEMQQCDRSMYGHAWYPASTTGPWQPSRNYIIRDVVECHRCGSFRYRGMNAYGEIETRYYQYPDGWKERWASFGGDKPPGEELRVAWHNEKLREQRRGSRS
jgi:hypothetical protein